MIVVMTAEAAAAAEVAAAEVAAAAEAPGGSKRVQQKRAPAGPRRAPAGPREISRNINFYARKWQCSTTA